MNINRIIEWHSQSRMLKVIDKAKRNIILVNSSILLNTLSPSVKTLSSEYILDDYEILSETSESLTLKNVHNATQIIIKKA